MFEGIVQETTLISGVKDCSLETKMDSEHPSASNLNQNSPIDFSRDSLFNDQAIKLLKDYYLVEGETSPQEAFYRAALAYSEGDLEFAKRIYDYASKGWFMFASPVLSNAPKPGQRWKSLPISCFLTFVPDSLEGLINHSSETRWLSVKGGGVGGHWSAVRSVSNIAPGPIPFIHTVDSDMTAYRQGKTRKGSYAAYMDISHPDIEEFLVLRVPTGGDPNRKCFNLHNAINITDKFMSAVIKDESWDLTDPHTHKVVHTVPSARELWQRILETRSRTGEPYLNFIDTANNHLPESQKNLGLKIHGSNLCNEIHLATDENRTAVCCLSSINLEYFDEWKDTTIVQDLIHMLDNVLQVFIDNCPDVLHKARFSAMRERSLGLGMMGFHSYLQRKEVPFESGLASSINRKLFRIIKERAVQESKRLATLKGEPEDMKGTGMRNAHLIAIAPNANSSIIVSCSPSIEPWKSNAYSHRTRAGTHLVKNIYLEKLLERIDKNTPEVWQSIILEKGSVQHLDFLTQDQKDIFKTAFELDQRWIVDHAASRQPHVCQGQSVNLFFPAGSDRGYVNEVHIMAWKRGLKGLYYYRSSAEKQADSISKSVSKPDLTSSGSNLECLACHA